MKNLLHSEVGSLRIVYRRTEEWGHDLSCVEELKE